MRFDHITVHVDPDRELLKKLQSTAAEQGYLFDPDSGHRNREFHAAQMNIGGEYIELVRLFKRGAKSWMPFWSAAYDAGSRGAYCIFLEVEDVERTAVALKKAGVAARGPSVLTYPYLLGLVKIESPYYVYYMPPFPGTCLQIALMQYKKPEQRASILAGLNPNAAQNGIHGIRRIEVDLPNLPESLPMLQKIFPDLQEENGGWLTLADKTRLFFREAEDGEARLRLHTVTSQRKLLGQHFQIHNVEVRTTGG